MALHEERNEQNRHGLSSHFEQERQDLSASVEAVLMDDGAFLPYLQNDVHDSQPKTDGTPIIPPQLSLQSMPLPVVRPQPFISDPENLSQARSSRIVDASEAQESPSSQHTGMLARLTQHFTSSLASIKLDRSQHALKSPPERLLPQESETHQMLPEVRQFSAPVEKMDAPLVRVIDTLASPNLNREEPPPEVDVRRPLKRNKKVRLQTTEQTAIKMPSSPMQKRTYETDEAFLNDAASRFQTEAPQVHTQHQEGHRDTTSHSLEELHSALSSGPAIPLYGSSCFESEQGDAVVANAHITASSVVLVTLTSNPGPVVVQYISLQPQQGFTVHLTAPVARRTTFNYMLLPGAAE